MRTDFDHLYVIGNGFDIFTGLRTRYLDFRWWLENNYIFVYEALISIYGTEGDLWNDFESQLGKLNIKKYIADYTPKYKSIVDLTDSIRKKREFEKENHLTHTVLFSDPCSSRLEGVLDILQYCFEKWVQNVQKGIFNPKYMHLEQDNSFFINFNYTDTLEMLYHIPDERVLHIHGRAVKKEKLIFGHDTHLFGDEKLGYEGNRVAEVLNKYEKNPYMYIPKDLSRKICLVEHIHVLGFSFSTVDLPYINWILENTKKDCKWEISWYSEKDKERINNFIFDTPSFWDRYKLIRLDELLIHS